jgi:hypothetical protein
MFELKFMQKPLIQVIVLAVAVLFVLDMGYRLFLEESYYLQTTQGGKVYRINKKTGEVYVIGLDIMKRVEDVTPKKRLNLEELEKLAYGEPLKKVPYYYYIDWGVTTIIIGVFVCANTLVWIIIQRKRKNASSLS